MQEGAGQEAGKAVCGQWGPVEGLNQAGDEETLPVPLTLSHLVVQLLSHVRLFATPWTAAR